MAALFRGYRAVGTKVPTYFIESTAPANVDDPPTHPTPPEQLTEIDPAIAIEEIAGHLSKANSPNLVIMVHGFNNSEAEVLEGYANASRAIETDPHITADDGLVCVGYRWTSEKMWQPIPGTFRALPSMLTWLFWSGVLLLLPYLIWMTIFGRDVYPILGHVFTISAWIVIGIVVAAALLRAIVYFRDAYRAASYAAPDLIEIVRHIDKRIIAADEGRVVAAKTVAADGDRVVAAETVTTDRDRTVATGIVAADKGSDAIRSAAKLHRNNSRVQLSFIGHSMGGFIVTNAIRVLSDLFADDASQRPSINAGVVNSSNAETVPSTIGNAFRLTRFVLASPDISAETLISNRANYLASSLRRFHEAYLFSNEGDEVLRQISTAANYFSFPTKDWRYGYRLGNLEILSSRYGLIEEAATPVAKALRVGQYTLDEIYQNLKDARDDDSVQNKLAELISYFDCTDYVDLDKDGAERGLLTFALRTKANNRTARMHWWSHIHLLISYLLPHQKPNVHGGYFEGQLCQQLMYRFACLGFQKTVVAFGGTAQLSAQCERKQIRGLLSASARRIAANLTSDGLGPQGNQSGH